MAWIRTIAYEDSEGGLRRQYDLALERAGRIYRIVGVQSLKPNQLQAGISLYVALMHGPSRLSRAQREMLAIVVSGVNDCHY